MESTTRRESDLVVPEGLEAGLIGGLTIVMVYLVPDVLAGSWLRTPSLLGALLFGAEPQEAQAASGGLAAAFTVVHFGAWALAGFAASWLTALAERRSDLRRVPAIVLWLWIAAMVGLDLWLRAAHLPTAHLWVGSVVAGIAVGAFLTWRHPALAADQGGGGGGTGTRR